MKRLLSFLVVFLVSDVTVGRSLGDSLKVRTGKWKKNRHELASVFHIPRGGADIGPLKAESLVKGFCGIAFAQGVVMNTGPKLSNDLYGIKAEDNDAMAQYFAGQFGLGIMCISISLYMLVVKGLSLALANQACYALWLYHGTRMLLSGTAAELGMEVPVKIVTTICAAAFWALSQDFSDTAMKPLAVLWGLSGLQMIFSPADAAKTWQAASSELSPATSFLTSHVGWYLLAIAVINLSILLKDATPLQAAGYNAAVWACMHLIYLLNGNYKNLSMPEGPMVVWCLLHSLIAYAALA